MATKLMIGSYGVVPYSFCIVSLLFKPVKPISEKNFFFVWPSLDVHSFLATDAAGVAVTFHGGTRWDIGHVGWLQYFWKQ